MKVVCKSSEGAKGLTVGKIYEIYNDEFYSISYPNIYLIKCDDDYFDSYPKWRFEKLSYIRRKKLDYLLSL